MRAILPSITIFYMQQCGYIAADLIWFGKEMDVREIFQSYFSKAYELAKTIQMINQLSELKDMWKQQKLTSNLRQNSIIILGIVVLIAWIALFAII